MRQCLLDQTGGGGIEGIPVKVCTVAGFPLGATHTAAKVAETLGALRDGAEEIDMVINIGALRGGERDQVKSDIEGVVLASHGHGAIVKVIIETCLLDDTQKSLACRLAQDAGADFVKTSTGFSKAGATVADVALMRRTVGSSMGVKASGGIRTLADLKAMVAAGATRIGASASVRIMQESAQENTAESGHESDHDRASRKTGRTVPRTQRTARFPARGRDADVGDSRTGRVARQRRRDRAPRHLRTIFSPSCCSTTSGKTCAFAMRVGHREEVVHNLALALGRRNCRSAAADPANRFCVPDVKTDDRYLSASDIRAQRTCACP